MNTRNNLYDQDLLKKRTTNKILVENDKKAEIKVENEWGNHRYHFKVIRIDLIDDSDFNNQNIGQPPKVNIIKIYNNAYKMLI